MGSKTRLSSYCTKRGDDTVNLVTSRKTNARLAHLLIVMKSRNLQSDPTTYNNDLPTRQQILGSLLLTGKVGSNKTSDIEISVISIGDVHIYQHFHKCTKGTLFLTPLPPPTKCTTKNVDFIVKNFNLRKTVMKVSSSVLVICS